MAHPVPMQFRDSDLEALATVSGRIAVLVPEGGALSPGARKLDRLMRGGLARFAGSDAFAKLKSGEALDMAFPGGLACDAVQVVKLDKRADAAAARKAGAAIGKALSKTATLVLAENHPRAADISFGLAMRAYDFTAHKTGEQPSLGPVTMMTANPEAIAAEAAPMAALAEGVFFTRDLVNEPANILTTYDFAARLAAMHELGLEVEILEEEDLTKLGMRALLGVGMGSETPSKVVVMQWHGGKKGEAPFALVGKGVVFDTGGISIKPAAGMEEMTMDMGGAAVVAGVMRTLAMRKSKANVVGIVGLVENMPDGRAQRPG
ncbi:MAG: M17 family peptidase N-terminal domain-containing protein, partial [Paracoccaceae bacterium]